MRTAVHLCALTLAGLALVACDGGPLESGTEKAVHTGPSQPSASTSAAVTHSLITKMIGAPFQVRFTGVRRYEAYWINNGQPESLIYRETVASDGTGQFAVDPLDLVEPVLTPPDEAQFLVLQKVREGLFFRYRDLVVRDEASFYKNYLTVDTGTTVQVVGRACAELSIRLASAATSKYLLAVDLENGLVLRAREELLDGTLVSLAEFETFSLSPDLSSVIYHSAVNDEVSLDPNMQGLNVTMGFAPQPPKQIPAGWKLIEFAKVVDPIDGRPWAKYVYSDGLELIFLVQAKPDPVHILDGAPPGPPYGTQTVTTSLIGLWTVLRGNLEGHEIVAMGKVDRLVLADLIQSTL